MSELKSIVITVCIVAGIILLLGGIVTCVYSETEVSVYSVSTFKRETIYPYRDIGIPLIVYGMALMAAGFAVQLSEEH